MTKRLIALRCGWLGWLGSSQSQERNPFLLDALWRLIVDSLLPPVKLLLLLSGFSFFFLAFFLLFRPVSEFDHNTIGFFLFQRWCVLKENSPGTERRWMTACWLRRLLEIIWTRNPMFLNTPAFTRFQILKNN